MKQERCPGLRILQQRKYVRSSAALNAEMRRRMRGILATFKRSKSPEEIGRKMGLTANPEAELEAILTGNEELTLFTVIQFCRAVGNFEWVVSDDLMRFVPIFETNRDSH